MAIITDRTAGGVLHLPDALASGCELAIYNRVSSRQQAGKGRAKLEAKDRAVLEAVRNVAPGRVRRVPISGVEEGKPTKPRPMLLEAAKYAQTRGLVLVASDLSRFLRAEAYNRRTNREAWPTAAEFEWLTKTTGGIVLATFEHPLATESVRHSKATTRPGQAGRPSAIVWPNTLRILDMLEWGEGATLQSVADEFGVTKAAVQRFWNEWKTYRSPTNAYRRARKLGELSPNGRRRVSKP